MGKMRELAPKDATIARKTWRQQTGNEPGNDADVPKGGS